jgi:beta-phosphoglucomutase-like phosphatase (HAD superfamily)
VNRRAWTGRRSDFKRFHWISELTRRLLNVCNTERKYGRGRHGEEFMPPVSYSYANLRSSAWQGCTGTSLFRHKYAQSHRVESSYTHIQSAPYDSGSNYGIGVDSSDEGSQTNTRLSPLERWKRLGPGWFGVICELDGTLTTDIDDFHRSAWRELATQENLRTPSEYELRQRHNFKAEQLISQVFNWTYNRVEIIRLCTRKQEILFKQLERSGVVNAIEPGALTLLGVLLSNDIPCVFLSQSTRSEAEHLLKNSSLLSYILPTTRTHPFQEDRARVPLITADDVMSGLPDVEGIMLCSSLMDRPFERIIVVGRSLQILEAACELSVHTIMVTGKQKAWELRRADLVVDSLDELCFQNFKNLLHDV